MKKLLLFFVFLTILTSASRVNAFHIVGGEIELVHLFDFTYALNVIQYFDAAQASNPGPDQSISVSIFRNGSSVLVEAFTLNLVANQVVPYTTPECAIGQLQTTRPLYTTRVTLDPDLYSDLSS